jgi:pyruvate dehydrogenase E2 component (dihydrolipoamide acetyltransferase)
MAEVFVLPKIGVNMVEATIIEWNVTVGDKINEEDVLVTVETDKAAQEISSSRSGTVLAILVEPGKTIACQEPIAVIGEAGEDIENLLGSFKGSEEKPVENEAPAEKPAAAPTPVPAVENAYISPVSSTGRIRISPLAKKMAKLNGINPAALSPASPGGRIVSNDVNLFLQGRGGSAAGSAAVEQRIPMTGIRRAIANRMSLSNQNVPRAALTLSVDATEILKWRAAAKKQGVKIGVTEIIIKALGKVLNDHPMMNARLEDDEYVVSSAANISVAVDSERGLLVPVIRDAASKSVSDISAELRNLAAKGRAGSLGPDEMAGGTFTLTNLGMIGIEEFVPVVNYPECGILAVGAIKNVIVEDEQHGNFSSKPFFKMTLAFDHRIIDGAPAARFLSDLKKVLEWPLGLVQ